MNKIRVAFWMRRSLGIHQPSSRNILLMIGSRVIKMASHINEFRKHFLFYLEKCERI